VNQQIPQREHNPLINSSAGGRALSAMQLPFFLLLPPPGYGVLTTRGRRTGKARRKCVRAIRRGDRAYMVAIKGPTAWLHNIRANPEVRLRTRGGTYPGTARELRPEEREQAAEAYGETVNWFEYLDFMMWAKGRPTAAKIRQLQRRRFERGVPLVIELED
jgi:deazaflavin-dependent oxidoreductase (nitroreductase family)